MNDQFVDAVNRASVKIAFVAIATSEEKGSGVFS